MQYIWEVVLAAEKNGIREADLQYEVPEAVSYTHLTLPTICSV